MSSGTNQSTVQSDAELRVISVKTEAGDIVKYSGNPAELSGARYETTKVLRRACAFSLEPWPRQPGSLTRHRPGNTRQASSTRQPGNPAAQHPATRQPGSRRAQTSCEDVRTGTRQPGNTRQHPGSDPATRQLLATPLKSPISRNV